MSYDEDSESHRRQIIYLNVYLDTASYSDSAIESPYLLLSAFASDHFKQCILTNVFRKVIIINTNLLRDFTRNWNNLSSIENTFRILARLQQCLDIDIER